MDCTLRIFPFYSFVIVMDFIRGNNSYQLIDKFNGKVTYNKKICVCFLLFQIVNGLHLYYR